MPADLREHFGKRELVRSTKTGDQRLAQSQALQWSAEAKAQFDRLRKGREATEADITDIARSVLSEGLSNLPKLAPGDDPEDFSDVIDIQLDGWGSVLSPHDRFPEGWPYDEAAQILRRRGFIVRDGSATLDRATHKIARAMVQVLQIALCRADGDWKTRPYDDLSNGGHDPSPAPAAFSGQPTGPRMAEVFDKYLAEGSRKWATKTAADYGVARAVFLDVLGDLPVAEVSRDHVRTLRDVLLRLPPNWRQAPVYRGRKAREIAAAAPKGTGLKPATVTRYLQAVSGALGFAVNEGWIDRNVASGLTHVVDTTPVQHRRLEWSAAQLTAWFTQDIYSAPKRDWTHRQWLPLLALFTGMRLEELARLLVADIRDTDGILAVHIEWRQGEPLKTRASERIVPVHEELLRIGFAKYVEHIRASGAERLWPGLKKSKATGKWGSAYSKLFGRQRRAAGVTDRRVTFHSFRATFMTALLNAEVPLERVQAVVGHAPQGVTLSTYRKRVDVRLLKADLDRLRYAVRMVYAPEELIVSSQAVITKRPTAEGDDYGLEDNPT